MRAARRFQLWLIEWGDRHLCHVTRSDRALLNARIRALSALDYKAILLLISILLLLLLLIRDKRRERDSIVDFR